MKKSIFIFIAGMISTLLIEFIIGFIVGVTNKSNGGYPGLTLFEEDGACISSAKQIEIFQTFEHNIALAHTQIHRGNYIKFDEDETLVLILGDENSHFYDEQKISVPKDKCAKRVGTYQYKNTEGILKTVPAVVIK